MFGRLLSRFAKLPAKEDIVSTARAVAVALSERDGVTPEQQFAAREDEQKSLAEERARSQALEQQLAAREDEHKLLAQERARSRAFERQLAAREDEQKILLLQERARSHAFERQLADRVDEQKKLLAQERARSQELEKQLAARGESEKLLAQERARSQELEKQLAARGESEKLLAQERARSQELEKQLAARGDNEKIPPPANESATPSLLRSDKPVIRALDNPATLAARPEAPGNPEAAGLMARARLLLDQGNIIAARSVLERAAANGSALALFLLAETYDPAMLSTWGFSGRRGNVTKAQKLYAKAVVEGVHEAKYRLSVLR